MKGREFSAMISLERKIKIKIFIGKIQLFTTVYFWTDKFASISSNSISWIIVILRFALSIESVFCKESTLKVELLLSCWSLQTPENLFCHYLCATELLAISKYPQLFSFQCHIEYIFWWDLCFDLIWVRECYGPLPPL